MRQAVLMFSVLATALVMRAPADAAPARSAFEFRQPAWGYSVVVASSRRRAWPAPFVMAPRSSSGRNREDTPAKQELDGGNVQESKSKADSVTPERRASGAASQQTGAAAEVATEAGVPLEQVSDLQTVTTAKQTKRPATEAVSSAENPKRTKAADEILPATVSSKPTLEPTTSTATPDTIVFPEQEALAPSRSDVFIPECDGIPYMARNVDTKKCQFLMISGDCAKGELFILDHDTLEPSCQPRPCENGQVLFKSKCRPEDSVCPTGMQPMVNEYGDIICDCAAGHVFWPRSDRCYPAFRQGPCPVGKYLTVVNSAGVCTDNVCVRDGAVFWPAARRCARLQDPDDSPCQYGQLDVNQESLQLECVSTLELAIFAFHAVRCSSGSKLDYVGACRVKLFQRFRSTLNEVQQADSGGKKCPPGTVKAPSGRCLRAANTG